MIAKNKAVCRYLYPNVLSFKRLFHEIIINIKDINFVLNTKKIIKYVL